MAVVWKRYYLAILRRNRNNVVMYVGTACYSKQVTVVYLAINNRNTDGCQCVDNILKPVDTQNLNKIQ